MFAAIAGAQNKYLATTATWSEISVQEGIARTYALETLLSDMLDSVKRARRNAAAVQATVHLDAVNAEPRVFAANSES